MQLTENLLWRGTTWPDRWVILFSAVLIALLAGHLFLRPVGEQAVIQRDNQTVLTLPLTRNQQVEVAGRLGPVAIQVRDGRVRLLEYASPRMIGTRSGWIATTGAMVACVPCGILIRVEGGLSDQNRADHFDGVAR